MKVIPAAPGAFFKHLQGVQGCSKLGSWHTKTCGMEYSTLEAWKLGSEKPGRS